MNTKIKEFAQDMSDRFAYKYNAELVTTYYSLYNKSVEGYMLEMLKFKTVIKDETCIVVNTQADTVLNSIYSVSFTGVDKRNMYLISGDGRSSDIFKYMNLSKLLGEQYLPAIISSNQNNILGDKFLVTKNINGMNIDFIFDKSKKVASFQTNRIEAYSNTSKHFEDIEEEYQILKPGYYMHDRKDKFAKCINISTNCTKNIYGFIDPKIEVSDPYLVNLPTEINITKGDDIKDKFTVEYDDYGMVRSISGNRANKLNLSYTQFIELSEEYPEIITLHPLLYDPFNVWFNLNEDISLWVMSCLCRNDDKLALIRNTFKIYDENDILKLISKINDYKIFKKNLF